MKKRSAIFTALMVVIILFIFLINIGDYNESYQLLSDDEITLSRIDIKSLFSNQSSSVSQSNDGTLKDFLNRTLIVIAVLLVLWSLSIYLATRLNLFMRQDDKKENKTKGR